MIEIPVHTAARNQLVDVTAQVQGAVSKSKAKNGICVIYCPHTTAAVTINENADPSVQQDILAKLSELVPRSAGYSHAEGNADAHIKAALIGNSRIVLVKGGKLVLGTWESCYFVEADGPRERKLFVKIIEG
jgi:secondary thiamine-phosphate synthase enzyme